jgi:hypothetical protein
LNRPSTAQRIAVTAAAIGYILSQRNHGAGTLHFIKAAPYLRIMPPYIPWAAAMVQISGAGEILGGIGLLFGWTRSETQDFGRSFYPIPPSCVCWVRAHGKRILNKKRRLFYRSTCVRRTEFIQAVTTPPQLTDSMGIIS